MDTFEDVRVAPPGATITFQIEDGKPISGVVVEIDAEKRTVTLGGIGGKRIIEFPPATSAPTTKDEA